MPALALLHRSPQDQQHLQRDGGGTRAALAQALLDLARRNPPGHQEGAQSSVETAANRISNNVALLAESIVLNYLALHDEVGTLDLVLPGHGLDSGAERDSLVAFQPIR
jgi:hypothetical protein